jgi:hypothetical protein
VEPLSPVSLVEDALARSEEPQPASPHQLEEDGLVQAREEEPLPQDAYKLLLQPTGRSCALLFRLSSPQLGPMVRRWST